MKQHCTNLEMNVTPVEPIVPTVPSVTLPEACKITIFTSGAEHLGKGQILKLHSSPTLANLASYIHTSFLAILMLLLEHITYSLTHSW